MKTSMTTRRRFLAGVGLLPFGMQDTPQADSGAAPLFYPSMAGRPRDRITEFENDPFIVSLEGKIRCTCGCNLDVYTCRTTDFTCATSPAMHRDVVSMYQEGRTAEEILDAFVETYGETVLMAPKKEGFNWAAYLLPGTAITGVGALLAWVLVRRGATVAAQPAPISHVDAEDQALLEEELTKLDL